MGPQQQKAEEASPQGGLLAGGGGHGAEQQPQLTSLVSQFAYTYKFRSLKGATEYHTEHQEGEEKDEDSKRADAVTSMLLPGLCKLSSNRCLFLYVGGGAAGPCVPLFREFCVVRRLMNPSEVRRFSCVAPVVMSMCFCFFRRPPETPPFQFFFFLPTYSRRSRFLLTLVRHDIACLPLRPPPRR